MECFLSHEEIFIGRVVFVDIIKELRNKQKELGWKVATFAVSVHCRPNSHLEAFPVGFFELCLAGFLGGVLEEAVTSLGRGRVNVLYGWKMWRVVLRAMVLSVCSCFAKNERAGVEHARSERVRRIGEVSVWGKGASGMISLVRSRPRPLSLSTPTRPQHDETSHSSLANTEPTTARPCPLRCPSSGHPDCQF